MSCKRRILGWQLFPLERLFLVANLTNWWLSSRDRHWAPTSISAHAHGFWVGMGAILLFMGGHRSCMGGHGCTLNGKCRSLLSSSPREATCLGDDRNPSLPFVSGLEKVHNFKCRFKNWLEGCFLKRAWPPRASRCLFSFLRNITKFLGSYCLEHAYDPKATPNSASWKCFSSSKPGFHKDDDLADATDSCHSPGIEYLNHQE